MNRRTFLKTSALTSAALGLGSNALVTEALAAPAKTPPGPLADITPPVLQNVSESAATVFWSASGPATGWVEYGETEALGQIARGEFGGLRPYDSRVLRIPLTGLQPGRKYFYRVQTAPIDFRGAYDIRRGDTIASPVYAFTTLNSAAGAARFTIWNDTHQNVTTLQKLVEHLPAHPTDFLLWNGDIFNEVATDEMLVRETLHPAGLEYAATRPLVFARGNHDVRGAHARALSRTLEAPAGKYYFSFRQGPIAFIVLDTGEDKDDAHPVYAGLGDFTAYRAEQRQWLERAVAQPEWRSAPFRVLITHIPLRGCPDTGRSGQLIHSEDSRAQWEPLLTAARIDFAFSGHTHRYFYSEPTTAQPWPLLVGGGPAPEKATYIHVEADSAEMQVRMFGIDARDLGQWRVTRRPAV